VSFDENICLYGRTQIAAAVVNIFAVIALNVVVNFVEVVAVKIVAVLLMCYLRAF
jgi:hypothetical protein